MKLTEQQKAAIELLNQAIEKIVEPGECDDSRTAINMTLEEKMNEDEKIARAKAYQQLDKVYAELRTFRRLLAEANVKGLEIVRIEVKVSDLILALTNYDDENFES